MVDRMHSTNGKKRLADDGEFACNHPNLAQIRPRSIRRALLERFVQHGDTAAFEVLVWRHGPMVIERLPAALAVTQDSEDAFQATFLTLVKKAGSISKRAGTRQLALQGRLSCRRTLKTERPTSACSETTHSTRPRSPRNTGRTRGRPAPSHRRGSQPFARAVPRPHRALLFRGQDHRRSGPATRLPPGTIASRLAWAKECLRERLVPPATRVHERRFGHVPGRRNRPGRRVDGLDSFRGERRVAVPNACGDHPCRPARVAELTEGVLRAMLMTKLKSPASRAGNYAARRRRL